MTAFGLGFAIELEKLADVVTPLQPHQQRVVDRIKKQPGLVVAHGLGSGKTLTSIAAQDALRMPETAIVPASLQQNYRKEIRKHTNKRPPTEVQSLQRVAGGKVEKTRPLMVVDEAHRLRNTESKTYQRVRDLSKGSEKRLLLTGSPWYNRPSDIAPLVDVAAGKDVLPTDPGKFDEKYVYQKEVKPGFIKRMMGVPSGFTPVLNKKTKGELEKTLNDWVDYHPGSREGFPTVEHEDVKVPMTGPQMKVYDSLMKNAPFWVRAKVKAGLPPSKQEAKQLNAFLAGVRQVSDSTASFQTKGKPSEPKIDEAFGRLQTHFKADPDSRAVVYSNFLASGIEPYKRRLEEAKIPFGEFTGAENRGEREQMVRDYNSGKIKVLLISSAGGEGLDLKRTGLMQVIDPHWNREKIRQVEGRVARFQSHAGLPTEKQKVRIERYYATRSPRGLLEKTHLKKPGGSVDQYLDQMSNSKDALLDQFRGLLHSEEQS